MHTMTAKPTPDSKHPAVCNSTGFDRISIQNYRGIAKLEIEDLGQINMIFGDSNSGKTTLLEAAFMLTAPRNIRLIVTVDNFRHFLWKSPTDAILSFHRSSPSKPIFLAGTVAKGNERRELVIHTLSGNEIPATLNLEGDRDSSKVPLITGRESTTETIVGLRSHFARCLGKDKTEFKQHLLFVDEEPKFAFDDAEEKQYRENMRAIFVISSSDYMYGINAIDECFKARKKGLLIGSLQEIFDDPIKDIDIDPDGHIYLDIEGQERQVPLNFMGGGTRRALEILATIHHRKNHIVLIDGFENGLFHRSLTKFWRPLFKAVKEAGAQVFLTFHSEDVLTSLTEYFINDKGSSKDKERVALFNLRKIQNGAMHKAYRYTVDEAIFNIRKGLEFRD